MHVPGIAQLATVRAPSFCGREAALGQRHLLGNAWRHRLLAILAEDGKARIAA
jgi:hypothetical protein